MKQSDTGSYALTDEKSYMTPSQLHYFKEKLITYKEDLNAQLILTRKKIQKLKTTNPDIVDRSNTLIALEQEIITSERYSLYLKNIDNALERIKQGTFGYCAITGNEIGLKRLEAQPWAILSFEALESLEISQYSLHTKSYVDTGII